ncbi:MAG: hypothetical protein ACOY32_11775 [Thermodesulfobacteriota bacterium]
MITGYSSRYGIACGKRAVRRRTVSQDLPVGGLFWKLSGAVVVIATLLALIGSSWISWSIKRGLGDLAAAQVRKQELRKGHKVLADQQNLLFSRKSIEDIAESRLALYPGEETDLGGGLVVLVPGK